MEICDKKIFAKLLVLIFFSTLSYAAENFESIKQKKTSYLDFILLKLENRIIHKSQILEPQSIVATRIQYSNIGIQVKYNENEEKISVRIRAIMDKLRYAKKPYNQKLSDCNQVRNLIFYGKTGYSFFTQKRSNILSEGEMEEIFERQFLYNLSLNDKEMDYLLNNILVEVTVVNPVTKKILSCRGKIQDWELL